MSVKYGETLHSPAQAGEALGVHEATIRKWILVGRMRAIKIGLKHYGITAAELTRLKAELADA